MAKFEFKLPEMGEGIKEATIINWQKSVGDFVAAEEILVEIATDKVDSDVPCPRDGRLIAILCAENDIAKIGQAIAIIETEKNAAQKLPFTENKATQNDEESIGEFAKNLEQEITTQIQAQKPKIHFSNSSNFYSPLIKSIATQENITEEVLEKIPGTGLGGRITKNDLLAYIARKKKQEKTQPNQIPPQEKQPKIDLELQKEDTFIRLSRMGKIISEHMLSSQNKAVHVQSVIDADVTDIVTWRAAHKDLFLKKTQQKLTLTPIFMMIIAKAIEKFPLVNIYFDGEDSVAVKKQINLGMAAALPDGNLIVPVIKKANALNLVQMATQVNDLANRAKNNQLNPADIKQGTYTVTNVGAFGTLIGTPIISQPQSAILALGAIRKTPCVTQDENGKDTVTIRHIMYLTHSYDHRVINGALGGQFILYIKELLEHWERFDKDF